MSQTGKIVVVGSCMIDFVSYVPRLPVAGETLHGHKFVTNFGGKGANQCVAAAKLGGNTALVARVGDDIWGSKYIDNLKTEKVDTYHVKKTENSSSGIAQINVADSGMNQIVIVAGANTKLSVADINEAKELIESASVLILQLETPVETAIAAMKMAKGKISILNGAPALSKFDNELLRLPSIFCVNESEASIFTGLPVNNEKEAELAAITLTTKGCQNVLITLGEQGAIYLTNDPTKPLIKVPAPKTTAIDTTGAGDAFIGALAYCIANGYSCNMEDAIKFACVAASDSVTRLGTQISFPGRDIVLKNLNV